MDGLDVETVSFVSMAWGKQLATTKPLGPQILFIFPFTNVFWVQLNLILDPKTPNWSFLLTSMNWFLAHLFCAWSGSTSTRCDQGSTAGGGPWSWLFWSSWDEGNSKREVFLLHVFMFWAAQGRTLLGNFWICRRNRPWCEQKPYPQEGVSLPSPLLFFLCQKQALQIEKRGGHERVTFSFFLRAHVCGFYVYNIEIDHRSLCRLKSCMNSTKDIRQAMVCRLRRCFS